MHFVGNLILSTSCELCYDDVTVMSFINIKTLPLKSSRSEQRASGMQKLVDRWDKMFDRSWTICWKTKH